MEKVTPETELLFFFPVLSIKNGLARTPSTPHQEEFCIPPSRQSTSLAMKKHKMQPKLMKQSFARCCDKETWKTWNWSSSLLLLPGSGQEVHPSLSHLKKRMLSSFLLLAPLPFASPDSWNPFRTRARSSVCLAQQDLNFKCFSLL